MRVKLAFLILVLSLFGGSPLLGQSPNASLSGVVLDPEKKSIADAEILVVNDYTRVQYEAKTNVEGFFAVSNLPPGQYRIQVSKVGFKAIIKPDIILNVQDALAITFTLPIGASSVVVTVVGGAPMLDTTDGTVSTIVDRQFAENLPMNGRSFQTLIMLTPGVAVVAPNGADNGQFSVNGQRASSNYWMVDGVGANIGVGTGYTGNGLGGAIGSFSALGGTNSLVSVDAMQEFRIQTSTYAPEFGRTPGGQISIVTRSGTSQFHGTLFDYLRNDAFDANNWFANASKQPKPRERQNDFGGTVSGPIVKERTFFFFSYEGLRLQLPEVSLTHVPDLASRQNAIPVMQPYLNAYPLPNGLDDAATGVADFNKSFSDPATLDAYSLRIDQRVGNRWTIFGRYNYSPSESDTRGPGGYGALSEILATRITTQTGTAGVTWTASPAISNELRFNYSRVNAQGYYYNDDFGGAVPLAAPPYPSGYDNTNAYFSLGIYELGVGEALTIGNQVKTIQRQLNIVDGLSYQKGSNSLKFGVDFRRLTPIYEPFQYSQTVAFSDVLSAQIGNALSGSVTSLNDFTAAFHNLAAYAQDTWRATPRLTLTYGLRWDVDFAPSTISGPSIPAVTGYNLADFSNLAVAPSGTAPFKTTYRNLAPRLGLAFQVSQKPDWQTVIRGGLGVFYDLVSAETGTALGQQYPPFGAFNSFNGTFPFTPAQVAPLQIPVVPTLAEFYGFSPNLKLPYTLEWNFTVEQSLGKDQALSASYVGSNGRRLLQTTTFFSPPPSAPPITDFQALSFVDNTATSEYNALQVQLHRRLSRGLQVLASYTWSHSIDDASAGSYAIASNTGVPGSNKENRGDSDFDIRNALTGGITYDVPALRGKPFIEATLRGWSIESLVVARSAPPVGISDVKFFELAGGNYTGIRPDVVVGQPFYLYGSEYPGGKALNPGAFTDPPSNNPDSGIPLRQGDLGRNALRGFGATQWDFALHRRFPLREWLTLQFRAEIFNVLNHPNFGPPLGSFREGGFGLSSQTLNQSLAGQSQGTGGFNPLYQIGGPRSVQLALKLIFR